MESVSKIGRTSPDTALKDHHFRNEPEPENETSGYFTTRRKRYKTW
jgi:hypothetical protein